MSTFVTNLLVSDVNSEILDSFLSVIMGIPFRKIKSRYAITKSEIYPTSTLKLIRSIELIGAYQCAYFLDLEKYSKFN